MSNRKKPTTEELKKAESYAKAIERGQIIDLGNIPSRDLGLITQGLMLQAAESYLQDQADAGSLPTPGRLPE